MCPPFQLLLKYLSPFTDIHCRFGYTLYCKMKLATPLLKRTVSRKQNLLENCAQKKIRLWHCQDVLATPLQICTVFSDHNTAHWLHLFRLRLHSLHPCRKTKTTLAAQLQNRLRLHWLHTCRYIVLVDEATFATPLQKDSGYTVSSL